MLRNEVIQVKGRSIEVSEFPARFKVIHGVTLAKIIPPLLSNVREIIKSVVPLLGGELGDLKPEDLTFEKILEIDLNLELLMDIDCSAIGNALKGVLEIQSGEEWFKFLEKFLEFTHVNNINAGQNFDSVFAEDFSLLLPVVFQTVKVNRFLGKGSTGTDPKTKAV